MQKKEEKRMSRNVKTKKPCTISESLAEAFMEVKGMREGTIPERSLDELFRKIEKWSREERG